MVSSKKAHCAYCQQKCSGSVLRYQDHYYHKQCFELLQSELVVAAQVNSQQQIPDLQVESATTATTVGSENGSNKINSDQPIQHHKQEQRTRGNLERSESPSSTKETHKYYHSKLSKTTTTTTTRHQKLISDNEDNINGLPQMTSTDYSQNKVQTLDSRQSNLSRSFNEQSQRSATLPQLSSSNGFDDTATSSVVNGQQQQPDLTKCAGCKEKICDKQALVALDLHWHICCFKCNHCKRPLHGDYVAKDGKAYCEKDYQKLFEVTCVYCKRYITGKVLQAGEAHHFHPSCARCSKCGDPFVPGEVMYLQGEVTWHPRCGPGPGGLTLPLSQINDSNSMIGPGEDSALESTPSRSQLRASRMHSPSLSSRSRSVSPFSYMSRQQHGRASPAYAESEAVGDLSRIYTISYLNADPNQGYLKRPIEPNPPKSPQFSRPTSLSRIGGAASDRSRCSSRSQQQLYSSSRERSVPPARGVYSVLSGMGRYRSGTSSSRARSPSMMNEEAIQSAAYPSGQRPSPDSVANIERDDFPAPPFARPQSHNLKHHQTSVQSVPSQLESTETKLVSTQQEHHQERVSRPRSREYTNVAATDLTQDQNSLVSSDDDDSIDPQFRKEEEELSKIANGIGKIFLQTLKEREKLRAWKRAHLDPRSSSRAPSATRELSSKPLRYDNPINASPSRDIDRSRSWEACEPHADDELSSTRTRSSMGRMSAVNSSRHQIPQSTASSNYGYKVVQANRSTPRPGYGLSGDLRASNGLGSSVMNGASEISFAEQQLSNDAQKPSVHSLGQQQQQQHLYGFNPSLASNAGAHFRRSMPNVANSRDSTLSKHHQQKFDGPPKLYPYHLLATTNYRLPPDVDRCHLERHLSNEEFQYIFHCDRLEFYRMPEWKRNELKRRAKLF